MELLQLNNIPLEDLVGFASDSAKIIMGAHITIFKCICHSMYLCASQAAKKLHEWAKILFHAFIPIFHIIQKE